VRVRNRARRSISQAFPRTISWNWRGWSTTSALATKLETAFGRFAFGDRQREYARHPKATSGFEPLDPSARLFSVARSASVDTSRIAAFPVFADLPVAELDELAATMSEVEIEAGANVITLDDYGTAI
jgi:hypothetical protein